MIELLQEMQRYGVKVSKGAKIRCKVFEDNNGALKMGKVHKYCPRTKHINVKLHHFRQYVENEDVEILPVDTTQQQADYLTKPVNKEILEYLCRQVMGW